MYGLVASDALARGVDLLVSLVINYDAPTRRTTSIAAARARRDRPRHYAIKGQTRTDRSRKVAPPTKVPRESVGALSSFIPDYVAA